VYLSAKRSVGKVIVGKMIVGKVIATRVHGTMTHKERKEKFQPYDENRKYRTYTIERKNPSRI